MQSRLDSGRQIYHEPGRVQPIGNGFFRIHTACGYTVRDLHGPTGHVFDTATALPRRLAATFAAPCGRCARVWNLAPRPRRPVETGPPAQLPLF